MCLSVIGIPFGAFARRKVTPLNHDWSFRLEQTADTITRKFKEWTPVVLPHDWSIELGYSQQETAGCTGYMPAGVGWYKKTFTLPVSERGRIHRLEFDGVYRNAQVFLNGKKVGYRPYGYSSFSVDLTPYIQYGQDNELVVKVDRKKYQDSRWYPGSGIYRPVRLVSNEATHIPKWGVFVSTQSIDNNEAKIRVQTELKHPQTSEITLEQIVIDANQQEVCRDEIKIAKSDTYLQDMAIARPKLWDIETPHIYTLKTIIKDDHSKIIDQTETPFGVRDFQFDAQKGFFLNGRNLKMKGVCLHQDLGSAGVATTRNMWEPILKQFKEMGANAIRCAHNPPSTEFLDLCDEMGFLVQDEIFDEWRVNKNKWTYHKNLSDQDYNVTFGYADLYEEWAERDVKDWIKRDRNHPSIIMWSLGNEIEWTYPYYWSMEKSSQPLSNAVLEEKGGGERELANTAVEIDAWIKTLDTSRPTTAGMVSPRAGTITGYTDAVDMTGYNYRADYYHTDHAKHPNRIIYGSENHPQYREWRDCIANDHISGIYVWAGMTYLGEAPTPYPQRAGAAGSFIDLGMFPTASYYMFKSLWTEEPMLHLVTQPYASSNYLVKGNEIVENPDNKRPDQWEWADVKPIWQYDDKELIYVESYSNCEEVELQLNGKVIDRKSMADQNDRIIKWVVPFEKGELKAIGYIDNKAVTEDVLASVNTQKPYSVKLEYDKAGMSKDLGAMWVKAYLVDDQGNRVTHEEQIINFEIEGPVSNKGVNHGNVFYVQPFKADQSMTDLGRCSLLLESKGEKGTVTVKATAQGGNTTSISFPII